MIIKDYRGFYTHTAEYRMEKQKDEYKLYIKAKRTYNLIDKQKAFDCDGNHIGYVENQVGSEDLIEEWEYKGYSYNVVQLDYKFHLMPIGWCHNQDEIHDGYKVLRDCYNFNFECDYNDNENLLNRGRLSDYLYRKPFEICVNGYSLEITKPSLNSFINLDIKEYTSHKNKFIKELKSIKMDHLIRKVESLYKLNIELMGAFYQVSPKSIIDNRFNKTLSLVNRINTNINLKQKRHETM